MLEAKKVSDYPYCYQEGKFLITIIKVKLFKTFQLGNQAEGKVRYIYMCAPQAEGKVSCMKIRMH